MNEKEGRRIGEAIYVREGMLQIVKLSSNHLFILFIIVFGKFLQISDLHKFVPSADYYNFEINYVSGNITHSAYSLKCAGSRLLELT